MPANTQMNRKDVQHTVYTYDSIDLMKFIGALMVVVIHTKPFQPYSNVLNIYTAEGICRMAVPFFFAASGMFLYQKLEQATEWLQIFRICIRQSGKNLRMYLSWSIVYCTIGVIRKGTLHWEFVIEQIRLFFCDASVYHFWYLIALCYGIPLMGIFFRWNRKWLIALCAAPWLYRCIWFVYRWIPGGNNIPWVTTYCEALRNTLTCAVPMMTIGILCWQDHGKKSDRYWRKWVIICLIMNILELTALFTLSPQKTHFEYLLTMPGLTYCFVNWLLTLEFQLENRMIPKLLRMSSIWIYCSHVVFIVIFGWFHSSLGFCRFAIVTGSLAISTMLYVLVKYCLGKRGKTKGN